MQTYPSLTDPNVTRLLREGAVGVLPTDTVYGLVCQANNPVAVAKLYQLKHREHKPGTIIAASIEQLVELGIKARYLKAVAQFWPGGVSVEIPHGLAYLHQGTGRQAMRIPEGAVLQGLLRAVGPLQTTSANLPGEPVAETIEEAQACFGDSVDFYVDGGNMAGKPPSTIIRVVDDAIEVIRQGAVTIEN